VYWHPITGIVSKNSLTKSGYFDKHSGFQPALESLMFIAKDAVMYENLATATAGNRHRLLRYARKDILVGYFHSNDNFCATHLPNSISGRYTGNQQRLQLTADS
jgi:hypothetical protein